MFLSFLSDQKCMHFRFANNYTHSEISRRDNIERRIKFKEGKLPRERRRSWGSIARKTSFKKCFHLRANFLFFFFFFFFSFFVLYFYAFFAPHDRCVERSSDSLPSRESLSSGKERYYLGREEPSSLTTYFITT